ncbi:hypothetical protein [Streptomyces sp. NPDC047981]|uniref:hypothetical protein n=1 Tax=Streptomyces sp. NPDC047981 TaxID=3154610 RepID=UPI00342911F9
MTLGKPQGGLAQATRLRAVPPRAQDVGANPGRDTRFAEIPATGTWNAPGNGGDQAGLVLTAPQDGVPLLFIEVDSCHETTEEFADKLGYARFFRRKENDTDGKERPKWRTRWNAPETWTGDRTHPPVVLVFNRIGECNPTSRSRA